MNPSTTSQRVWLILAYLTPVWVIALLLGIYAVSPAFYLTYVLELRHREYQAVEITTFLASLIASFLLGYGAWRLWRGLPARPADTPGLWNAFDHHFVWLFPAAVGVASFFLAGEEINWGQTFLHWGVAEDMQDRSTILNLHNTTELVSIQSLGSIFNIVVFGVAPVMWWLRKPLNLPAAWAPAIPWGPACVTALAGGLWSKAKDVYVARTDDLENDRFYWEFMEQVVEQKEMLIGLGLFMAGAHLVWRLRRRRDGVEAAR